MTMRAGWLISAVVVMACGGSKKKEPAEPPAPPPPAAAEPAAAKAAKASLKDAKGAEVGSATFTQADGGVEVAIEVSGLKPGKHGYHIHAVGKCEGPDFKSAGGHFNPHNKKHG